MTAVPVPPIPTAQAVDGARLLGELRAAFTRYVVLPSPQAADAVTLWTAATHAQPAWEHAPRLAVVSPLKRCGKSRLLDVVAETCHAPLITVNATIAAVVRSIGADPPTLLVDEADTLWGTSKQADANEDLRGLLNAGHQRNRPMLRWDVTSRTAEQLDTFAMALLAAIGELPDTIMDRAVVVRMRRRAPGEQVDPYRTRRDAPPLHDLRESLSGWARQHLHELQHAQPAMPLEDRAADTWEPLIAIADLAGGDWPARARARRRDHDRCRGPAGRRHLGQRAAAGRPPPGLPHRRRRGPVHQHHPGGPAPAGGRPLGRLVRPPPHHPRPGQAAAPLPGRVQEHPRARHRRPPQGLCPRRPTGRLGTLCAATSAT